MKKNIDIFKRINTVDEKEKTALREELYKRLKDKYEIMKAKGVLQFHFVLSDNTTFLRMHKPQKYNDDISTIRYSFKYVNETKKPTRGLESGRTTHAFRNVYPILDENKNHLGALEISFSSDYLQWYLTNINKLHVHFLIKEKLFDSTIWKRNDKVVEYIKSAENKDFMISFDKNSHLIKQCITDYTKRLKVQQENIGLKMGQKEPFGIYNTHNEYTEAIAFYPIKDIKNEDTVAWLVSYTNDEFISSTLFGVKIVRGVFFILFVILFYFIYRVINQTKLLNRQVNEKTKNLKKLTEIAQKAARAKSDFLANMSHEIRTPLNAILGFIDLLKEQNKDKKSLEYIQIIDNSSKHLLGIINDILDFSKIESGKLEIENRNFEARKEFDSTINLFKAKAVEKNITLKIDIDSNLPKYICSDSLRIKQIISNLLSNAIKFTPNDKNIYLQINYKNNNLYISVEDEGIGIPKNRQNEIFNAFSQADTSTTRKFGGSGLGLSISAELVKLLGGKIEVQSDMGIGSRFFFSIPINKDKNIINDKIDDISKKKLQGRILLVEDNKANQMFMELILKKLGLSYEIANDGLEAVEKYKDLTYNLILMDENMPNMNGIEATKQILKYENDKNLIHTPIIALTANALKGDREKFMQAGLDDYMTKPVDKKRLLEIFSKYLQ